MKNTDRQRNESPHIPVLLDEVLQSFEGTTEPGVLIDCTLGYAGHSAALLEAHPGLRLVGIDRDREALEFSARRLAPYGGNRVELLQGSFSALLPSLLESSPPVALLADFGVSSLQLDKRERGFSFESEELDMRMDPSSGLSAYDVVNDYPAERLDRIFREYGEIRQAGRLAEAIVRARSRKPIRSGRELAELIAGVLPRHGKTHPATQPFQAIRIEVNDELGEIERLLDTLEATPPAGAVVSLITFHSLEDRLVKNRFREWSRDCICPPGTPRCLCGGGHALGRPLSRKPVTASPEELRRNSRSRSAKLRSFRFFDRPRSEER
ncbi:16S rRNA (cytosine(1402)-N(4))-methyltransferase RsmH [Nitratifractor sp.]